LISDDIDKRAFRRILDASAAWRARAPLTWAFGVGLLFAVLGALLRAAVLGVDLDRAAYLTFWPGVTIAALIGGVPAAAWTVALSAVAVHSTFIPLRDVNDWLGLGMFLAMGGLISGAVELCLSARSRMLAAVETQSAKSHLAAIVEGSADPILSKDLNGIILSWNAAASRLFGYEAEEIVGCSITMLIPSDIEAEEREIIGKLRRGERIDHYETRRLAKDGRALEVALTISPIRDGEGKIVGASKIIRDISQRRRDEQRLRTAQQRVELATAITGAGVWEWNLQTNESVWDAQMFRIYGLAPMPDGAVGYDVWARAVLPEDLPRQEDLLRACAGACGVGRRQFRIRRPDGVIRVIEAVETVRCNACGVVESFVGVNLDVTEARRAEQALRLSQARLRHAANAAGLTYVQFDLRDRRVQVAENFGRVMGYAPLTPPDGGPLDGARVALLSHVAAPDRAHVSGMFDEIFSGRGAQETFRVRGDDGAIRWFEGVANPEPARDGEIHRVFATLLDVTSAVEAQAALEAAKALAERADLAKSKFLAAASHDLRQPVQSLVLLLALLERQVRETAAAKTARLMQQALSGLTGLLTSILDMSRLDAGVVEAEPRAVDLAEVLRRLAGEYRAKAQAQGLKLRCVPGRFHVFVDPALLERALRNLLENALRYTKTGAILLGVRRRGGLVRIDVIDTGIGIPADRRADIFEEFVQVGNPGRDLGLGLGLGLAIVARLAALMGAEIDVDSAPGRGSRFSLALPPPETLEETAGAESDGAAEGGGRLLLVEDNAILLQSLESLTRSWGYATLVATGGEEALTQAAEAGWDIDAIVSDQRLGAGLSGLETAREIRRKAQRDIPTLILTGDTAAEQIAEITSSGFELLHKPAPEDSLRHCLAVMTAARAERERQAAAG